MIQRHQAVLSDVEQVQRRGQAGHRAHPAAAHLRPPRRGAPAGPRRQQRHRRHGAMLRRTLGEHIDLIITPAPGLWPVKADPGQLDRSWSTSPSTPATPCPGGGKLSIDTATSRWTMLTRRPGLADGPLHAAARLGHGYRHGPARWRPGCSSHSSPPSRTGRAPGWGSPPSTPSSARPAATPTSIPSPAWAPPSPPCCRHGRGRHRRRHHGTGARPRPRRDRSCSPRMRRPSPG